MKITIETNGYRLSIPADMVWAFDGGKYYEINVIHFLDKIISYYNNPVFLDIGANCGYYSIRYSNQCKKVFSFEPVLATYNVLSKNIKRNSISNIKAFRYGLSNAKREVFINLYNSSANNSIFKRTIPEGHSLKNIGREEIKLIALDELLDSGRIEVPDIIKIDVEGAELQVLQGAKKTILNHRPTILLEYSENTSLDAGYAKNVLLDYVNFENYKIYGISENPSDLRLIPEKDFDSTELSNIIFFPTELDSTF